MGIKMDDSLSGYHASTSLWKAHLETSLVEDQWQWDWTTRGVMTNPGLRTRRHTARVVAKSHGIWAAEGLDQAVAQLAGQEGFELECRPTLSNGKGFKPGDIITRWTGTAESLLVFERTYLNLASWSSGIATRTRALVEIIDQSWKQQGTTGTLEKPRLTATRKTLPGFRDISIQAVLAGGGFSHRNSLAGGVLIKENHIAAAGGIRSAVQGAKSVAPHGLRIEVEVRNQAELEEALSVGVDCIMLDNFRPEEVRAALDGPIASAKLRPWIEVSGGISDSNVRSYVMPGVNIISSGGLTHSVVSSDLSMLIDWV